MTPSDTVAGAAPRARRFRALDIFLLLSRLALGAIFIYAGYVKLREPWELFAMNINGYQILPLSMAELAAHVIPWFEVALGVWLLTGFWLRASGTLASLILLTFIGLMGRAYLKGMQIDCGCFGSGDPISWKTLLRDGSMAADAVAMTVLAFRRK